LIGNKLKPYENTVTLIRIINANKIRRKSAQIKRMFFEKSNQYWLKSVASKFDVPQ